MADENSASYKKIGLAVALGAVAIAAVLFWLGGLEGRYGFVYAETYCDKPVSGLSVGSTVNFRGVKIGQVARIGFVGDEYGVSGSDAYKIFILMSISGTSEEMLRRQPIRATVVPSGVTGLSRIEIDMVPDSGKEPSNLAWEPKNMYIPYKPSFLDNFSDSATKIMNEMRKMNFQQVWSNVSETVGTVMQVSDDVRSIMESNKAEFEKIIGDVSETASSVRALAEELKSNPSLLLRSNDPDRLPETR
jgi:phospholipid/cholesterol/gamma-HCH transport system substrate-binding protein